MRDEITKHFEQESDCDDIYLNSSDIEDFIDILECYLDRDYYKENANSVWEYEEYLVHNIYALENLKVLKKYLEEFPNTKCYFYDSY